MKKKYYVTLQASATVQLRRCLYAETEESARQELLALIVAINSGEVAQNGEFTYPLSLVDASFEITEAPQLGHDFQLEDIELEVDDSPAEDEE